MTGDCAITIVYDNGLYRKTLKSGHGFSCLLKCYNKSILFDTGANPENLLFNLNTLGIEPKSFDGIVLSHAHPDHAGGLKALLEKQVKCPIYFADIFGVNFKEELRRKHIEFREITELTEIAKNVFAGPRMKGFGIKEISLTVVRDNGLVIITGCAHPGVLNIAKKIKQIFKKDIHLILGGFHLEFSLALNRVVKGLKNLPARQVAPCHCTGEKALKFFQNVFGENFINIGTGSSIKIG